MTKVRISSLISSSSSKPVISKVNWMVKFFRQCLSYIVLFNREEKVVRHTYLQSCNRRTSCCNNNYVRKRLLSLERLIKKGQIRCPYIRLLDFTQGAGHILVFDILVFDR